MFNVVILDDNLAIRQSIKRVIGKLQKEEKKIAIYSSANGVEGLGLIFTTNPQVVIIDLTLPKYSGREVIDYITSNPSVQKESKVIVLHENSSYQKFDIPEHFIVIDKSKSNALQKLEIELRQSFGLDTHAGISILNRQLLKWANVSDRIMHEIAKHTSFIQKLFWYPLWFVAQLLVSFYLGVQHISQREVPEANIEQKRADKNAIRTRAFPTIATVLATLFISVLQVSLFVSGGMVLLNTRIESIFALGQGEKGYEFTTEFASSYQYDEDLIEFTDSGVVLRLEEQQSEEDLTLSQPDPQIIEDNIEVDQPQEEQTSPPESNNEEEGEETSQPVSAPDVLGIDSDVPEELIDPTLETVESTPRYTTTKPSIITLEGVTYSEINALEERSTLPDSTNITYQVSPNLDTWYYFNQVETYWEETTQGWVSSNTMTELQENITSYNESFGSGTLYFKIFLHSNGSDTPILTELVVEKERDLFTTTSSEGPEQPQAQEQIIETIDFNQVQPVIFIASYYQGNKIVTGKILNNDPLIKTTYTVSEETLQNYEVEIRYTTGEVIGTTDLFINPRGEVAFELRTPEREGGFVEAKVRLKSQISNDQSQNESEVSEAIENSTFTVDSTADDADATLDGVCATAAAECTLRAAIQEANNVLGADNIHFNIPTTDPGYRDYDAPDTPSSGDSAGGDDYWTIRPATALPDITDATILDGATQTTNIADANVEGPEIEIRGPGVTSTEYDAFKLTGNNIHINSFVVNDFDGDAIEISGDTVEVTNSYLGMQIRGLQPLGNEKGIRVSNPANNVQIGNTTADGNVIAGNTQNEVLVNTEFNVNIQGNIVGMNKTTNELTKSTSSRVLLIQASGSGTVLVGGANTNQRNYIGQGNQRYRQVRVDSSGSAGTTTVIFQNNYFNVGLNGNILDLAGTSAQAVDVQGTASNADPLDLHVGKDGIGNFFAMVDMLRFDADDDSNLYITNNECLSSTCISGFKDSATQTGEFVIENNVMVTSSADLELFSTDSLYELGEGRTEAIALFGSTADVNGNYINGFAEGLALKTGYDNSSDDRFFATLESFGGTNSQIGSKCFGSEQNCFVDTEVVILNVGQDNIEVAQITSNNSLTNVEKLKQVYWNGLFELVTGSQRRTDIPVGQISFNTENYNFPSNTFIGQGVFSNYIDECDPISLCTSVNGLEDNSAFVSDLAFLELVPGFPQYQLIDIDYRDLTSQILDRFFQYEVLASGEVIEYISEINPIKVDEPHLAMKPFAFNGKKDSFESYLDTEDIGQPWSQNPTGDGDPATNNYTYAQIPQLQLVDANPIQQDDGTWVITVDSTTDEDNVSLSGYDDGEGAYSGGGLEGPDGLSDGKTSLREAIIVANNFAEPVTIEFNILESDAGYINPDGSRTSTAEPAGTYTVTNTGYWYIDSPIAGYYDINKKEALTIDGYSQPGSSRNTNSIGQELNATLRISLHVYNIEIIEAHGLHITGLNIKGHDHTIIGENVGLGVKDNIWVEGNYLGTNVDGSNQLIGQSDETGNGGIRLNSGETINNFIIGTNGDGSGDVGEFNIISGPNHSVSGLITIYSFEPVNDLRISGNYMFTDKTGEACSPFNGDRAVIEFGGGGLITNGIIGSNLDGVSDENESNVAGCIDTNFRSYFRTYSMQKSIVANNYLGISPNGVDLRESSGTQGAIQIGNNTNVEYIGNIVQPYDGATQGAFNIVLNNSNLLIRDNHVVGGPVSVGIAGEGDGKVFNNLFEGYTDAGVFVNNANTDFSLYENEYKPTSSVRKHIHLGDIVAGSLPALSNDSGDTDIGPNDLQNYPVIENVEYLGAGQYRLSGILDNNVSGEGTFDLEICLAGDADTPAHSSGHGGCLETLFYEENYIAQVDGGLNPWSAVVTVAGSDGADGVVFSTLATNANGSTSEFSANFTATESNPDYVVVEYDIPLVYPTDNVELTDVTPQLDWNLAQIDGIVNPDIAQYDIYIDGEFVDAILSNSTEFQIQTPLSLGEHTWQIVGYRGTPGNLTETARSTVETFTITEPNFDFVPTYPITTDELLVLDDTTPLFQWNTIEDDSGSAVNYDLYIDDELIATEIEETEYQIEYELEEGEYEWYVVAYRVEPDGSRTEIGRTTTQRFGITLAAFTQEVVSLPVAEEEPEIQTTQEEEDNNQGILIVCGGVSLLILLVGVGLYVYEEKRRGTKNSKSQNSKT